MPDQNNKGQFIQLTVQGILYIVIVKLEQQGL